MILELNGFDRTNPTNTEVSVGSDVLEVWLNDPGEMLPVVRAAYFREPSSNHCLIVSIVEGGSYRFAFDDAYIDDVYPPTLNLPSDADLELMLQDLVS